MNTSLDVLIDFSECQSAEEYKRQFHSLSDHLIRNCIFEYKNFKFRIIDLEFGAFDPGILNFAVHCRELQTKAGYWYIQTIKTSQTFKIPQRIGMDMTCGFTRSDGSDVFATLLIKGIQVISNSSTDMIEGSAKCFNSIFYQTNQIPDMVGRKWDEDEKDEFSQISHSSIWDGPIRLVSENLNDSYSSISSLDPISIKVNTEYKTDVEFNLNGFRKKIEATSDVNKAISKYLELSCGLNEINIPIDITKPDLKEPIIKSSKESKAVSNRNKSFVQEGQAISTQSLVKEFLESIGGLKIGSGLFSMDKLIKLKTRDDIKKIPNGSGCYFIFTNLDDNKIPCISADGYACFENKIDEFKCIYNGKAESLKSRLTHHLFNNHTLDKVRKGKNSNLSSTGGMSLTYITNKQIQDLENEGLKIKTNNLKPFKKSLHPESYIKDPDGAFFINGINIEEECWSKYEFAVVVVKTDSELGKALVEEGFALENGRPPLCKRFG